MNDIDISVHRRWGSLGNFSPVAICPGYAMGALWG